MSEAQQCNIEMCTKCGEFPQSTRKGVKKGLCCNRCPDHGPWCSSRCAGDVTCANQGRAKQLLPKSQNLPKAPAAAAVELPVRASARGQKRTAAAANEVKESAPSQEGAARGPPQKRCKWSGQLRSIVKAVKDEQRAPKSVCAKLSTSLSALCPITSELGFCQRRAFRSFHETLNSIEAKKAEEVQQAEATALQAQHELQEFESAAATAEMEMEASRGDMEAKSAEAESIAALSALGPNPQIAQEQAACAAALAQAESMFRQKTDALDEKNRLLPGLRALTAELVEDISATRKRLEDYQTGPLADFQEISTELVMRHGMAILNENHPEETGAQGLPEHSDMQHGGSDALLESAKLPSLSCLFGDGSDPVVGEAQTGVRRSKSIGGA